MVLEGVVTNVTKFGAFVDIGVHQDGLVHISELSNRFIKDPSEAVKAGADCESESAECGREGETNRALNQSIAEPSGEIRASETRAAAATSEHGRQAGSAVVEMANAHVAKFKRVDLLLRRSRGPARPAMRVRAPFE